MFRISRVRIRWIDRHSPVEIPADRGASRAFDPLSLRIRLRWVGFAPVGVPNAPGIFKPIQPSRARVLTTIDLPNVRLRLSWIGLSTLNRPFIAVIVLLILLVAYWAWTGTNTNSADQTSNPEQGLPSNLLSDDINTGGETIRLIHSPLDIGQAKDAFDNNLDTLMRGRDANPFIMDFEFPQPEAIKGFTLDMGRMDFYLRVKVYAPGNGKPVEYQGEFRQQPPIPHVDMSFANGPAQVRRIYIEIEQINPPEQVHVHIREVVFKK